MLNRLLSFALSSAIVLAVGVSIAPVWCEEKATSEENLAMLEAIDADLAKKPNDIAFQLQHAEVLGKLKRYEEQIAEANRLLKRDPGLREAYLLRFGGEANLQLYAEALISLERAIKLGDPTPKLLFYKADCLKHEKRYSEAIKVLDQVIKASPSYYEAYRCRSICIYRLNGPCADALRDMEKVVLLNPSDVAAKNVVSSLKRELQLKTPTHM